MAKFARQLPRFGRGHEQICRPSVYLRRRAVSVDSVACRVAVSPPGTPAARSSHAFAAHGSPHNAVVQGLEVSRGDVLQHQLPAPVLARDSIDQAFLLAEHMSGDAGSQLIVQAKAAFDIAFAAVLVAGTAIMLLMAAVIAK